MKTGCKTSSYYQVPYIRVPTNKLQEVLTFEAYEPVQQEELIAKMSDRFNIKPHTADEYTKSLVSLNMVGKV